MFGVFKKKGGPAAVGDPRTTPSAARLNDFGRFLNGLPDAELRGFTAWAEDLVHRYGEVLEAHPAGVADAAELPVGEGGAGGKADIKVALKAFMIYKLGPDDMASLDALRASYVALSRFQDLAGTDPSGREAAAAAEAEGLRRELRAYFQ
jgi:hypothetical protein